MSEKVFLRAAREGFRGPFRLAHALLLAILSVVSMFVAHGTSSPAARGPESRSFSDR